MMKPALLVLAAGMGSRYGGDKQLDKVGPAGQTIIDYSIYDAVRAGFGKIVFVIRRDIEQQFKSYFMRPLEGRVDIDYVFQDMNDLPDGYEPSPERVKPWGTSHAILVARDKLNVPFGVINSDDYYGVDSFKILYDFLVNDKDDNNYCIVGYRMGNTLSDHGHVNRGVCKTDNKGNLVNIVETRRIEKRPDGIFAPGPKGRELEFDADEIVSMNLWGFKPSCFKYLEEEFINFIERSAGNPNAELDIPTSMDVYVKKGEINIQVLMTEGKWFGVTYREDRPFVVRSLQDMVDKDIYPEKLWK
ncbi:MAG: NTP transferase domain-containing protein [Bacteroidales bacterium]|nr:NTP transferase domain-containing protein [Bacteroidales bacterium]